MHNSVSETVRLDLLSKALPIAAFEGWTGKTLRKAVEDAGLPQGAETLYFPGGPTEMLTLWGAVCDEQVVIRLSELDLASMKIRQRVTCGVIARLEAMAGHEEAARRALTTLALPSSGLAGSKSLWAASDTIWRAIGDTSTDANFYSKRTVLSAVISSSALAWLNDSDLEKTKARAFLDRRIENVMQFEKTKATFKKTQAGFPNPIDFLSSLRYGSARRRR